MIEVCWEGNAIVYAKEKALVRNAVKQFIEGNSQFRFGDQWDACDADGRARIRIRIADSMAESDVGYQYFESALYGPAIGPTQMTMNFQLLATKPALAPKSIGKDVYRP